MKTRSISYLISDVSDVPIGKKLDTARSGERVAWILQIPIERGILILLSVRTTNLFKDNTELKCNITWSN